MADRRSKKSPRRGRKRRWFILLLVLTLTAVGWTWYYLTRPHRLAAYASGVLREIFRGVEPAIDSARFNIHGEIELRGLHLNIQGVAGPGGEVFRAERAMLFVDPRTLLSGRPQVQRIIVVQPVLSVTQVAPDRYNIDLLRELASSRVGGSALPRLPSVLVQEGSVRYGEVLGHEYHELGRLELSGRLAPDQDDSTLYHFQLSEHPGGAEAGPGGTRLVGRFDVDDLSVHAEMSRLALSNPHRSMLPRQVRSWWDQLEPEGAISGIRFEYSEAGGARAELKVQDVALTIPQLGTPEYKPRITDVAGTFRFEGERMYVEELVGRIEDLQYRIDGTIHGYSSDAPFTLLLRTQPLRIPQEPKYMLALPPRVQRTIRMFSPSGWLSASVTAHRSEAAGPIDLRGKATILSGREVLDALRAAGHDTGDLRADSPQLISRGQYARFPYEVTNLRGLVTFSDESVEIRGVVGETAGGGRVTVDGKVSPPTQEAFVDLTIAAVDVPLDETLYAAMGPQRRTVVEQFFHEPSWQRLYEAGLVMSARQPVSDGDQPPVFELGGRFSGTVKVQGPAGAGRRPDYRITVDVSRANVLFKHFPYPLHITSGRIHVTRHRVDLDQVRFTGLGGGQGGVVGQVSLPLSDAGYTIVPRIGLHARDFPVDELLLASIGEPFARRLRDLKIEGVVAADGIVFRDAAADRIDADLSVALSDATARPGEYLLNDVAGRMQVSLDRVRIDTLTGRHGDSTLELSGLVERGGPDGPAVKLDVVASSMRFEEPVLDLVRPFAAGTEGIEALWNERRPAGIFDAQAQFDSTAGQYHLTVRPSSLSFSQGEHRVELSEMSGRVTVDPDAVRIDALAGRFEGGDLVLDGRAPRNAGLPQFSFVLKGDNVTPALLNMLPAPLASLLRAVAFQGRYEFNAPSITFHDLRHGAARIQGAVTVEGGSARVGVALTDVHAKIDVTAETGPTPSLHLAGRADRLHIVDRLIEGLQVELRRVEEDHFELTIDRGACAGGQIGGTGTIRADDGAFEIRLALAEAELAQLSIPGGAAPGNDRGNGGPPSALSGRVSASLDLQGIWDKPQSLRGLGSISVRGSQLRSVPVAMDLLRLAHLTLPTATTFDSAHVAYYLFHDRMVFESIELLAPTMRLGGRGQMSLPQQQLNIALTTSNPRGLNLGPLTALIAKVRDQLITIRITGTLDRPVTRVQQLQGLSEAVADVLGEDDPKVSKSQVTRQP